MDERFACLEDYGIVGNQETCAVIGKNGSVDWLPLPYLDSPSVFAAILDRARGGLFSVTPVLKYQSIQHYLVDTNVLATEFTTAAGETSVIDFMPPRAAGGECRMLLRRVKAVRLDTRVQLSFQPRFDYGREKATVKKERRGVVAQAGERVLWLSGADLETAEGEAFGTVGLKEGEVCWLVLGWGERRTPPTAKECERLLRKTVDFWRRWSRNHARSTPVESELYEELAMRSGLALKLLINDESGAVAAAATMALPEAIGGVRNWDYRFAWIRDASFTAQALFHLGYGKEAREYRNWVLSILKSLGDLSEVKPCYPLHEAAQSEEGIVDSLGGYRDSAPVRVGNLASLQTQMDVYGEVVNTVFETVRYGQELEPEVWEAVRRICDFVAEEWQRKDRGIWEMRTEARDYVHSKLMCWVALDRGLTMARKKGLEAPLEKWEKAAGEVRKAILERGFSKKLNSFVQAFDGEDLDASALFIPLHRFLPPEDPRVQSTIDAVWKRLSAGDGLLYRYAIDDGLAGKEGAFILCSFWLVSALAVSRRTAEAEDVFRRMLRRVSPLGLFSEEIDPRDGKLIGNFPQAISHIGLINAALHLGIAKGSCCDLPLPQSEAHDGT